MWITPKPFGVPALLGFWACGKAWDAPGIFWGKRHFGAPARGFWRRGGRAGRQPPGGNAEPRPPKGRFWPPQKRLSTLSPKALSPKSGEKIPAVTGVLAARPQTFHQVIHRSLRAAGRKRPAPKTAPKEAKRYTLQHYIILCQPTQIKGWAEDGGRGVTFLS